MGLLQKKDGNVDLPTNELPEDEVPIQEAEVVIGLDVARALKRREDHVADSEGMKTELQLFPSEFDSFEESTL